MPTLIPNYLTVDPATGVVGADFTGHVHAAGLDLDVYTAGGLVPADHQLRFLNADGSTGARIISQNTLPATLRDLLLQVLDGTGGVAHIELVTDDTGSTFSSVIARADGPGGSMEKVVVSDTGHSDFVQNNAVGLAALAVDVEDTGIVSLNGGVAVGANGTWDQVFTHNLHVAPTWATAMTIVGGTGFVGFPRLVSGRTALDVTIRFQLVNGAALAAASTARFLTIAVG